MRVGKLLAGIIATLTLIHFCRSNVFGNTALYAVFLE
jgi:hypothetical protein